jgi:hypothetical protein
MKPQEIWPIRVKGILIPVRKPQFNLPCAR